MYQGKLVETAPTEELFAAPKHEYTKKLLAAIPKPDPALERERRGGHEYEKTILILLFSIFVLSTTVFFCIQDGSGDPLVSYYGDRVERMSPQERVWAEESWDWTMELWF